MGVSMKKVIYVLILLSTVSTLFFAQCGGSANTLATASLTAMRTALGLNNTYGMIPYANLGEITLPACTTDDGSAVSFDITYAVTELPSWLSFDALTRVISLASGAAVPIDVLTATEVTYTCTDDADSTISASQAFTINDVNGDGIVDGIEYKYSAVPLVNANGWFWMTIDNVSLYRAGSSPFNMPTGIVVTATGLDATSSDDDDTDLDGDEEATGGGTNAEELTANTNPFVFATEGLFGTKTDYTNVSLPQDIVTADFNGDGDVDLAIPNYGDSTVTLLLGDGDGTFTDSGESFNVGGAHYYIATADFDEDGNMDLALPNAAENNVTVLLGDGDGTFTDSGSSPSTGAVPYIVAVGDFDGDGTVDLAITVSDALTVLLGDGDGTFTDSGENPATGDTVYDLIAADFDNDGNMDIAVAISSDDNVVILLGDGDGTFTASDEDATTGEDPNAVVAGDFDGDWHLDLAVTNSADDTVSILLGNGDGTFSTDATYATGSAPEGIATADLDGDGNVDLVVANKDGDSMSVLLGDGDGTFQKKTDYTTGDGPWGVAIADFDGDGALDAATTGFSAVPVVSTVSIFLNQ
jgi:hypothetical protein